MLTSSVGITAVYIYMTWFKQNAVALAVASMTAVGGYATSEVTRAVDYTSLANKVSLIEGTQREALAKYVPIIEKNSDNILITQDRLSRTEKLAVQTAQIAHQNTLKMQGLIEDRELLRGLDTKVDRLTNQLGIVRNDVNHLVKEVNTLK